jgi:hypothetical protein
MESKGEMLRYILFTGQLILILYQSAMLVFFSANGFHGQAFFIVMALVTTILVILITNEEIFEAEKVPSIVMIEKIGRGLELEKDSINKWRKEYSHPLLPISASHQAHAFGAEILKRDNWHEFIDDEQMKRFLSRLEEREESVKLSIHSRMSYSMHQVRRTFERV